MKYRPRIYYSDAQKTLMWDRWQKGDSMHTIARLFDRRLLWCGRHADNFGQHQPAHHRYKCAAGERCAGRISGLNGLAFPGRGSSARLISEREILSLRKFLRK